MAEPTPKSEVKSAPASEARKPLSQGMKILIVGAVAALVALVLGQTPFAKQFEDRIYDLRFKLRRQWSVDPSTHQPSHIYPHLALVGIGNNDNKTFGAFPWHRGLQAEMLATFTNLSPHPRVVGYDVLFTSPKTDTPEQIEGDRKFVEAIQQAGTICLAGNLETQDFTKDAKLDLSWVAGESIPIEPGAAGPNLKLEPHKNISLPASMFTEGSHFGLINATRDDDGVHRRMPILIREGNYWIPSLAMRAVMLYHEVELAEVKVDGNSVVFKKSNGVPVRIPVETENDALLMWVNFRGTVRPTPQTPNGDFAASSFAGVIGWEKEDLKSGKGDPEDFKSLKRFMNAAQDGIVLVGQTTTGVDLGATPLNSGTALIECHLNVANTILTEDFLCFLPFPWIAALTVALSLLAVWATQKFSAVLSSSISIGALLFFVVAIWFAFSSRSIVVPLIVPGAGFLLAFTAGIILRFMGEERQKRHLRGTFQKYLSANIMEEVLKNPAAVQMGGVRKELTVLFTDVRGFTTFCEKNQPETVVPILNELLDVCSVAIARHDGTLDKYIGDAIMAFWGAPVTMKDHAVRAATAALEMRTVMEKLRAEWEKRGIPHLHLGVGINTGEMLVGNVGSSRLQNYTVIGDEVNLGARLESETRKFDTDIIISESTAERLGPEFRTKFLSEVTVKGKQKPVRIYSLEGFTVAK